LAGRKITSTDIKKSRTDLNYDAIILYLNDSSKKSTKYFLKAIIPCSYWFN
jgi:hypothetical protein